MNPWKLFLETVMKEFKEWMVEKAFPDSTTRGGVQWDYCEMAWRAALEWVLKGLEDECELLDLPWVGEFIEKELGDRDGNME